MIQSFFQNDGSIRHPVWGSFEKWDMVFTPTKRLIPNNRKANTCKAAVVIYTKFKSYESYAPPPPSLTKLSPIALLMYFKNLLNILMYNSRKEFTTTELTSMWQSILYIYDRWWSVFNFRIWSLANFWENICRKCSADNCFQDIKSKLSHGRSYSKTVEADTT